MLRLIGRLILVALGTFAAAVVSIAVAFTLGAERLVQQVPDARIGTNTLDQALGWIEHAQFFWGVASISSIVPAVLVIAIGEIGRLRSMLYYVPAGGIALAVLPWLAQASAGATLALPQTTLLQVLATAGFAGGLTYWAIAGRTA